MAAPEGIEYGGGGGECACAPPPATSHVPVAPQARPTIAAEERPREAMPAVTEEAERVWDRTHIND